MARASDKADQRAKYESIGEGLFGTTNIDHKTPQLKSFLERTGRDKEPEKSVYKHVCHLMNQDVGWRKFVEAYVQKDWTIEPTKVFVEAKTLLFELAVQLSKTKQKQKEEGLRNGSDKLTAMGRFWHTACLSGMPPTRDQLLAAAEAAAAKGLTPSQKQINLGPDRPAPPSLTPGAAVATSTPKRSNSKSRRVLGAISSADNRAAPAAAPAGRGRGSIQSRISRHPPSSTVTSGAFEALGRTPPPPSDAGLRLGRGANQPTAPAPSSTQTRSGGFPGKIINTNPQSSSFKPCRQQNFFDLLNVDTEFPPISAGDGTELDRAELDNRYRARSWADLHKNAVAKQSHSAQSVSVDVAPRQPLIQTNNDGFGQDEMESEAPESIGAGLSQNSAGKLNALASKVTLGSTVSTHFNSDSPPLSIGISRLPEKGASAGSGPAGTTAPGAKPTPAGGTGTNRSREPATPTRRPSSSANSSTASDEVRTGRRAQMSDRNAPLIPPAPSSSARPQLSAPVTPTRGAEATAGTPGRVDSPESGGEDDGRRVIISNLDGSPLTGDLAREVKREAEIQLFVLIKNKTAGGPIFLDTWTFKRNSWIVTPGGANPDSHGDRFIKVMNEKVRVRGRKFKTDWNFNYNKIAHLTVRFACGGSPKELLEDPDIGAVAMNGWPAKLQGRIRFLKISNEEGSNRRLARFEANEEIVELIRANKGVMRIGFELATVQSGGEDLKPGLEVVYKLQK